MAPLKRFSDIINELSMKSDKKLPNLKMPVKGKKGTSKFMRMKVHNAPYTSDYKKAMNAGFKTDANRKAAFAKMNDSVQSADRKPEKYIKPDGKVGIRMVKTDKEVIKKEASVLKPTKPTDITKHARTLAKNDADYNRNKKKYIDKARAKVFRMYPKESIDEAVKNLSATDQVKAAIKIIRDKRFNDKFQIDKKTAIQKISKDLLKDPKVKKEIDKIYEENIDEALNLAQRMKRSRLMKRMKSRIKIGRQRAMKKMG